MLFKIYLIEQLKAFVIILACFFKQLFAILPRLFVKNLCAPNFIHR